MGDGVIWASSRLSCSQMTQKTPEDLRVEVKLAYVKLISVSSGFCVNSGAASKLGMSIVLSDISLSMRLSRPGMFRI